MDNKKYECYEDTHKKLVEAMQEACSTKEFGEYKIPDIDLSFLEYDYEFDETGEHQMPEIYIKKKNTYFSRFSKVAAVIVILLLSINIFMLVTESTDSYGKKGLLHRISQSVTGIITDGDKPIYYNEVVEEHQITSMNDIEKIVDRFPELYIPEYIPKGFELETLTVSLLESGDFAAKYIYKNENQKLFIGISYTADSMNKVYSVDGEELLQLEDRKVCIYHDVDSAKYMADIYFEDCIIDVFGIDDKNELINIAINLHRAR